MHKLRSVVARFVHGRRLLFSSSVMSAPAEACFRSRFPRPAPGTWTPKACFEDFSMQLQQMGCSRDSHEVA
ncbi:hypothetical protein KCU62_g476, partial [Aureobasidium sp. EXF-3399]